jgi:6-phospho-3-hexuloisomerase
MRFTCMAVGERMAHLAGKIAENAREIDERSTKRLIRELNRAKSVFLCGAGRSGYVAKAFAMRLMHLGLNVYVVGEATTPAITDRDLLIAVTGSGETHTIVGIAEAAKKRRARVAAITSNPKSGIAKFSDSIVVIKGRVPGMLEKDYLARQMKGGHEPLAPLGTLFELSTMVFFDSLVEELMVLKKRDEDYLKARHTQLE